MNRYVTPIFVISFIVLGLILRVVNITPHNLYPDSYQNLLVAQNLRQNHNVVGTLGKDGMVYPPYFMWTRSMYPFLINLGNQFFSNELLAAHAINLIFAALSIILAFYLYKHLFNSSSAGMIGSLLIATSFSAVAWSGFILTESLALCVLLLLLLILILRIKTVPKFADMYDVLTGIIFSVAVFTRYEYSVLILPIAFLMFLKSHKPLVRLANIIFSSVCVTIVILSMFYPIVDVWIGLTTQMQRIVPLGLSMMLVGFVILILGKYVPLLKNQKLLNVITTGLTIVFLATILFITIFHTAANVFVKNDLLVSISFLIGMVLLGRNKQYRPYFYFVLITMVILLPLYYLMNPQNQRYYTHLLPFFIIASSYGILQVLEKYKTIAYSVFIALVLLQIYVSFQGMKQWQHGVFTRTSYNQKSAEFIAESYLNKSVLLITSEPEPYYYHSGISTQSIADNKPFIFIDTTLKNKELIIIEDMGMRHFFPNFSNFLENNLQKFVVQKYSVNELYLYGLKSSKEQFPVVVYKLQLSKFYDILSGKNI